jgi:hypothetical protein
LNLVSATQNNASAADAGNSDNPASPGQPPDNGGNN